MNTNDLYDFSPELETAFENAEVKESGKMEDVPNGEYVVRLDKFEVKKLESGDRQASYWLSVLQGQHKDRLMFKNSYLNAKGMTFFKSELAFLGIKLAKLADLPDVVDALNPVDPANKKLIRVSKVQQKSNPKYSNVYFNEVVDESELEDQAPMSKSELPQF